MSNTIGIAPPNQNANRIGCRGTALDLHHHIRALDRQACALNRTVNDTVGIKVE
jgi:hypothetical protein